MCVLCVQSASTALQPILPLALRVQQVAMRVLQGLLPVLSALLVLTRVLREQALV